MCSVEKIDSLFKYLYHSIFDSRARKESKCINIITILNLTVYRIFYLGQNSEKDILKAQNLINLLLSPTFNLSNSVVLKYVQNVGEFISNGNIYISTLSRIYNLKEIYRAGWINRGVNKHRHTESVADHTWACCQLALLFLPENIEDCKFAEPAELSILEHEYNLSKIIQMLIIHDLGESYTGDIVIEHKSDTDETSERDYLRTLVTLDTLPHFGTFGYIDNLAKEFKEQITYNSKLAKDIDLMEPLIQLFLYRKDLDSYQQDKGVHERDKWVKGVQDRLSTTLGQNLLDFLYRQILCHFDL